MLERKTEILCRTSLISVVQTRCNAVQLSACPLRRNGFTDCLSSDS